mmetsp:Transcript_86700/g.280142  ORF Transcript_86700/g.280142 Transcript_86700/m.280142 type:complete len:237 (-) Transcript_86700:316-1026(-)
MCLGDEAQGHRPNPGGSTRRDFSAQQRCVRRHRPPVVVRQQIQCIEPVLCRLQHLTRRLLRWALRLELLRARRNMLLPTEDSETRPADACHFDPRDARLGLKQSPHPAPAAQGLPSLIAEVPMLEFQGPAEPFTLQVAFVGLLKRTQGARDQRLPERLGQFRDLTCARRSRRHRQRQGAALPLRPLRQRGGGRLRRGAFLVGRAAGSGSRPRIPESDPHHSGQRRLGDRTCQCPRR